jgi:hypothetical protein
MRNSPDIEPSLRRSMKGLAGDYQSLAVEILQEWVETSNEFEETA